MSAAVDNATGAEPSAEPSSAEKRLTEKDIAGLKSFDQLLPLFQRLHVDGCERDRAGIVEQ